jgi:hypothetical protein
MGLLEGIAPTSDEAVYTEEVERNPWENLLVSLERNTYKILGDVATGVKLFSGIDPKDLEGARLGMGWIGKAAITAESFWDEKAEVERLTPETDPELMDKFAELVGASAPYIALTAATGGAGAGAAVGAGGTAGFGAAVGAGFGAFTAMKGRAYKEAIESGATEEQAMIESDIIGGINALIEVAQLGTVLRATKSGTVLGKALTTTIRNKAWSKIAAAGGKSSMELIRQAATEGLEEALQGTTEDVVPFILRGKEIEEGFAKRRAGEFAAGALLGGLFGVIGSMAQVSYDAGKGRVIAIPEIESMEVDETSMSVKEADTTLAENPEAAGREQPAAEMSPELAQVADAAQDGQELEAGSQDMNEVANRAYMKGFAAKVTTIKNSADNMLAGAGNPKAQAEVMKKELSDIISHYDKISQDIDSSEELADLRQAKEIMPEYKKAVEDFLANPTKEGYAEIKRLTGILSEAGQALQSKVGLTETKEPVKQGVQNIIRKRLNEDASAKDRLGYTVSQIDVKKIRKATAKEMSIEKGKRFAEAENIRQEILKSTGDPDYAIAAAQKQLGGEYSKARFMPVDESVLTDTDWRELKIEIHNSELQTGEKINAYHAVEKLKEGIIPPPFEAKMLERALKMPGFLNQVVTTGVRKGKPITNTLLEIINFPRTLLAGVGDNSMPGRQGITLFFKHPKIWWKNNINGYRAMMDANGSWAQAKQNDILTSRYADKPGFMDMITDIDGTMRNMEESYLSHAAKNIPVLGAVVRAGQRAATVSMNGMRADFFSKIAEQWEGTGKTDQDYKDLANLANDLTGRGHGKTLAKLGPYLNAGFFAPRFTVSRFQLVGDLALTTPAVRKIAAAELATFMAGGLTLMGMASLLGAKVEKDPRSSDFGKIKIGRTRVDIWAGYTQIARLLAGEITGKGKSIRTGETYKRNRLEVFGRYVQSKLSPAASLGVELLNGKDYMGEPLPERVRTPEGAIQYAIEKVAPLVFQDTLEALRFEGVGQAAWTFPLAFQGIGVQTYEPRPLDFLTDAKNHYAAKVYQAKWDDIGPMSQKLLKAQYPQIEELENKVRMERMEIGNTLQEQQDAGWRVQRSLPKDVQKELEKANFFVGGLSRRLNRDWRLNQKLYKEYEEKTSELLSKLLPELIRAEWFQSLDTASRNLVLTEYVNAAKGSIRGTMVGQAILRDVERTQ